MSDTADTAANQAPRPDLVPRIVLLLGAAIAFGALAFQTLVGGGMSLEEVGYLIRSLWYTGGQVAPYTATDATGQMPLYFYQLGFWQQIESIGPLSGRLMSVGMGVINGILLFAICRRLTANTLAAAAGVFIFLATPATAVYFATATPAATVSALHLGAIWLIVSNLGRPNAGATVAMGVLCAAMYFYRQNMLLSVLVLAPLYIAGIGRQRGLHTLVLVAVIAATAAAILFSFPGKLGDYAVRLPVISPLLENLGILAPNFTLIDRGTVGTMTMGPAFERIAPAGILDGFLLPYSGTLILALVLFAVTGKGLRVLWVVPLYFLGLAVAHYLASLGYCTDCITSYAPYFSGVGALAAAISLAMLAHRARGRQIPAAPLIMTGAVVAVALNTFAPLLALEPAARAFPTAMMTQAQPNPEGRDAEAMARWINTSVPPREPVLVLHSMGSRRLASLPYAVFLAEHPMPAQSLNPGASRRVINPQLAGPAREAVQAALEEESLWSDATFTRWIDRDYDFILFQLDSSVDQRALLGAIAERFDLAGAALYRGTTVQLYKRKAVQ
jgi:hypothetical protein